MRKKTGNCKNIDAKVIENDFSLIRLKENKPFPI